jgi:hypothetical protein
MIYDLSQWLASCGLWVNPILVPVAFFEQSHIASFMHCLGSNHKAE